MSRPKTFKKFIEAVEKIIKAELTGTGLRVISYSFTGGDTVEQAVEVLKGSAQWLRHQKSR